MGGRGASSASYFGYGTEYKSIHSFSNIKFLFNTAQKNTKAPLETRTRNRVYVTLNYNTGVPQYISYYDTEGKKFKVIDAHNRRHYNPVAKGTRLRKLDKVHRHSGYEHSEIGSGNLNVQERRMRLLVLTEYRKNVRTKAKQYIQKRRGNDFPR